MCGLPTKLNGYLHWNVFGTKYSDFVTLLEPGDDKIEKGKG